ncbi:MAG TPA: recombinase family protein [Steroidobacteraceae bacterium]|jgi:DNA invertase Pin-like site-specific DNA recombinase|nr:recombinase family protein [Steroidobacteraceae bacterium]
MSQIDTAPAVAHPSVSAPAGAPGWSACPNKIQAWHHERLAIVYVRQSSPQQILEHRESTALQYALLERAKAWGWPPTRILVIDEDQGQSGRTAANRSGFQRLLLEVNQDRVGLIFGLEMSRLARSNKDWHHLLEVCALVNTLLADLDGVYDPCLPNDRLLLGLKGTMSEAELYTMRSRLYQGRLNKARRGELFTQAPTGYVRDSPHALAMDPDAEVQHVVRLLFDQFDALGSARQLLRYLARQKIRMPIRPFYGPQRGQLEWRRPCAGTLLKILHHPNYAGIYCYGRKRAQHRRRSCGAGRAAMGQPESWTVWLPGQLPAYISYERFQMNQRRLAQNRSIGQARGAPRSGAALLAGMARCGRCGRRLAVEYRGKRGIPSYACIDAARSYAAPPCLRVVAGPVDEIVTRQMLRALTPAALEVSLQAAADLEAERQRLEQHWQLRRQRAAYETQRAARQYNAVEPEHRLVAHALEQQWNEALVNQRQLEDEYQRWQQQLPAELTAEDQVLLGELANDLPALWQAPTTSPEDRKMIVRHLLEQVVVDTQANHEIIDLKLHWAGGFISHCQGRRSVPRYQRLRDYQPLVERILELRGVGQTGSQIAACLNREGFHSPRRGKTFTRDMVYQILARCGLTHARPSWRGDFQRDEWPSRRLAATLGISLMTVHRWMQRGWVLGRRSTAAHRPWIVWADAAELDRLGHLRDYVRAGRCRSIPPSLTRPTRSLSRTN